MYTRIGSCRSRSFLQQKALTLGVSLQQPALTWAMAKSDIQK